MHYLQAIDEELDHKKKVSDYLKDKGEKIRKDALSNLCPCDPRSDCWYEDVGELRDDCYCDCCFYGKHKLAVTILEMLDLLEG